MFCDDDDEVSRDWVETLLAGAKSHPDRLVNVEVANISINGAVKERHISRYKIASLLEPNEYFYLWDSGTSPYVWIRIFNSKIVKDNGLFFDESMKPVGEDATFVVDYLKLIGRKMFYIPKCCYHWIDNDGNSTSRRYIPNYYDILKKLYWLRKELMDDSQIVYYANHEFYRMIHDCLIDGLRMILVMFAIS